MTNPGAFILTNDSLTIVVGNKNHNLNRSHSFFNQILESLKAGDWDKVVEDLNFASKLDDGGAITFNAEEGVVYYGDEPLHSTLANRITDMWKEGFDTKPLVAFCNNLYQNPSPTAIEELYDFLANNHLPLTPDGCFLAYKKVRDNYMDCHTGSIDNSVGQVVQMDRNICDPVRENHCSTGLHFCGLSYLTCFGGERVMIVKVNPKDVTSIPSDYNFAKGRCCGYEVVEEYGGTDVQRFDAFSASVADWDEDYNEEGCDGPGDEDYCDDCGEYHSDCTCEKEEEVEEGFDEEVEETEMVESSNPIHRARLAAGLSVMEVCQELGITPNAFYHQEREGAHPKPSVVGLALCAIQNLSGNRGEM